MPNLRDEWDYVFRKFREFGVEISKEREEEIYDYLEEEILVLYLARDKEGYWLFNANPPLCKDTATGTTYFSSIYVDEIMEQRMRFDTNPFPGTSVDMGDVIEVLVSGQEL